MINNKLKSVVSIVLSLVLLFLLSGCSDGKTYVDPPMFCVKDEETGGIVYMLGTFHVGPQGTVFPEKMYNAIDAVDAVAVELDLLELDQNSSYVAEEMKVYDVDNVKDIMGEEEYERSKKYLEDLGIYNENYDTYMPVMWASAISSKVTVDQGLYSAYGADREVLKYAKSKDKEVRELETLPDQYHLQADLSYEYQMYMLNDAMDTPAEDMKKEVLEMYKAWRTNDTEALDNLLADYDNVPEEVKEENDKYYDAMYTDRQQKMAEKIDSYLQNGEKVFVAVGALHYYAEPDIIDFLTEKGYTVEAY